MKCFKYIKQFLEETKKKKKKKKGRIKKIRTKFVQKER